MSHIKEKYASQEFYSISQMANKMTGEARPYEQKRSNFQKKVNFVDCSDTSDSDDDQMVGSAEWIQNNKKPISCPFGNKEPEKYGFDITKADKIFDLLLSEGQIKLKPYHRIPTDLELKNIKFCKWHMQCLMTPMSARYFVSRLNRLSSRAGSSLRLPRSR